MYTQSVLLIYRHSFNENAPTIMEHVNAFDRYSKFKIWPVNIEHGFPRGLEKIKFSAIILHYSTYIWSWGDDIIRFRHPNALPKKFSNYIKKSNDSIKIAFFQDEMSNCQQRFLMLNELNIDIVFSLLDPKYFDEVYFNNTSINHVLPTLTGYVCDSLIKKGDQFSKSFEDREVDVGYRARSLPFWMGKGAQEKSKIADLFIERTSDSNLKIDIKTSEGDRIYGDNWNHFVGNCKFMLGVEAGTSIFDIEGKVEKFVNDFLILYPNASFDEVEKEILLPYEEKINYRTISPRIFECASTRTCMVLFRGVYQGILKPDVHYIPLEKDFSNIEEVLKKMKDNVYVTSVLSNAFNDLIDSKKYHYSKFLSDFDGVLNKYISKKSSELTESQIEEILSNDIWLRNLVIQFNKIRSIPFPGRKYLNSFKNKVLFFLNSNKK